MASLGCHPLLADDSAGGDDESSEQQKDNPGKAKGKAKEKNKEGSDASSKGGQPQCKKQAQKLFNACGHEVLAERWHTQAECASLADEADRWDCSISSNMFYQEAKRDCKETRTLRRETCDALGDDADAGWSGVDFVDGVSIDGNEFLPLTAGATSYVTATTRIEREVTAVVRLVDGRDCLLVTEEERDADTDLLLERREILYAEDVANTLWHCGEYRQQYSVLDEGSDPVVTGVEGSWLAGADGALAGIAMPAGQPLAGDVFRRALAPGVNEDTATVLDPQGMETSIECGADCVLLEVSSPLEPGQSRLEYYHSGTGLVRSETGDRVVEIVP